MSEKLIIASGPVIIEDGKLLVNKNDKSSGNVKDQSKLLHSINCLINYNLNLNFVRF